jgi:hypothetical protein
VRWWLSVRQVLLSARLWAMPQPPARLWPAGPSVQPRRRTPADSNSGDSKIIGNIFFMRALLVRK